MQFLKNMFSKPLVLWNVGEQLTMTAFVVLGLVVVFGSVYLICCLKEKIDRHKRRKKK